MIQERRTSLFTLDDLMRFAHGSKVKIKGKGWVPLRPLGTTGWRHRLRIALLVFRGKADAVIWPEGQ